jgi:hypothetical protein
VENTWIRKDAGPIRPKRNSPSYLGPSLIRLSWVLGTHSGCEASRLRPNARQWRRQGQTDAPPPNSTNEAILVELEAKTTTPLWRTCSTSRKGWTSGYLSTTRTSQSLASSAGGPYMSVHTLTIRGSRPHLIIYSNTSRSRL